MIEAPVVSVHIPPSLRELTGGVREAMVSGDTVSEALHALDREYPGVFARLVEEHGNLRHDVRLYLGGEDITRRNALETSLAGSELLVIVPV